jgi:hypothetical protein
MYRRFYQEELPNSFCVINRQEDVTQEGAEEDE